MKKLCHRRIIVSIEVSQNFWNELYLGDFAALWAPYMFASSVIWNTQHSIAVITSELYWHRFAPRLQGLTFKDAPRMTMSQDDNRTAGVFSSVSTD